VAKRLARTKSYKRHKDPKKTMKDQGIKEPMTPARVRESARVKEDCQVSRIQNPKSLEDWHNTRVKT
jgi:hypothetical protein